MDDKMDKEKRIPENEEPFTEEELDREALEWIFKQYDATFRNLAKR